MSKIFSRTFRVRWSELDATGKVSPAAYLRYLVETAYDWGDALGLGARNDQALGLFWLIRETEINLLRPLHHNDIFDFTIWMVNWQRVRGSRCFELTLRDSGEVVAYGTQNIVCMDEKTQRPASPPEAIIDNFRIAEPRTFPFSRFSKPVSATAFQQITRRRVQWQDLDALQHVNNANYVSFAEEAVTQYFADRGLPVFDLAKNNQVFSLKRIHIQYLSPAIWGEQLTLQTNLETINTGGGTFYIGMQRDDASVVAECILDWGLVDMASGVDSTVSSDILALLQR